MGNVPVTPVVRGNPVRLVATPEVGVPRSGFTRVGDVDRTTLPVPVEVVVPVPPLRTGKIPVTFDVRSIEPASWALVTFPAPIAVTPVLDMVTSPVGTTAAATLVLLPTRIFPDVSAEPMGDPDPLLMAAVVTAVTLPLASTVMTGTEVALPYLFAVTPVVVSVVAFPTEVTSPVRLAFVVTLPAVNPAAVPVILVPTKADGVPKLGVTKVGELDNTLLPVPVEVVTPVPPLSTGRIPVVPVERFAISTSVCQVGTPFALAVSTL